VRAILLHGSERLHDDAALSEQRGHLWPGEVGKVTNASHVCTLPVGRRGARQNGR